MTEKNQAFVILTPGFAASEMDSSCLPMQQRFVRTLRELYPQLSIFILAFQYPFREETYQWEKLTVMAFNGRNRGGIQRLLLQPRIFKSLNKINETHHIIGLLSFWYGECALIGKRFAQKHGLHHLCWILGQDARNQNHYPSKLQLPAENLVALSDSLQEEFQRNHQIRPLHIIAPGIDAVDLNGNTYERDIDLLAVGSLIELKQFEIFVEIVENLKNKFPKIKAVLAGKGPEREKLENLVKEKKLDNYLQLTGELSYGEVLQLMKRSKILLHPSSYEGFSGVCQEALASGAAVISFCRAMNHEIENWHIVSSKDEMTDKAVAILSGQPPSGKPVLPFSMNDTVKKMLAIYRF